ncbi:MAG: sarcosine oxidase subunit gamma [Haloechinothrix sp.]
MSDAVPVARSPITPAPPEVVVAGWVVSGCDSDAAFTLTDCTPLAKVAVRASADGQLARTLGVPFGRAARQVWDLGTSETEVLLVGSGPGQWLALASPGAQAELVGRLERTAAARPAEMVSVVDLTHGRAVVRITGVRSADLLAKECGIDLADQICPDGTAFSCAVAGLACDVIRDDRMGVRSYLVHCERSSGQYLFDALLDAGAEFGVETAGWWSS